eukprot:12431484-Karenia_brevis.AAC.3
MPGNCYLANEISHVLPLFMDEFIKWRGTDPALGLLLCQITSTCLIRSREGRAHCIFMYILAWGCEMSPDR